MYAAAITDCTRILDKTSDPKILKLRAEIYHAKKDFESAIKDYETFLQSKAESGDLRDKLNAIHEEFEAADELKYNCFILGVDQRATYDEIKRKYHRLSLIHHPDKNCGSGKETSQRLNRAAAYFRNTQGGKKENKKTETKKK